MKLELNEAFKRAEIMSSYQRYRQQDVLGQRFANQPALRLDINTGQHLTQPAAQRSYTPNEHKQAAEVAAKRLQQQQAARPAKDQPANTQPAKAQLNQSRAVEAKKQPTPAGQNKTNQPTR